MEYNDFRALVLKLNSKKKFKVTNSYGILDAYKWLKNNNLIPDWIEDYKHFSTVIKDINKELFLQLLKSKKIHLPQHFGILEIRKSETKIKVINGKVRTTLPIDWKATLHLWKEDEEAYNKRQLIRMEVPYVFRIFYKKKYARYKHKNMYKFELTRANKLYIENKIVEDNFDTFLLKNEIH